LALLTLLTLTGCAKVQVWMGIKVSLEKLPITALEARVTQGPGLAPGARSPLVVMITGADGKAYLTEGAAGGKVMWRDLQVVASHATATAKGQVSLAADPRETDGVTPHLTVTVPSQPGMKAELDIPVRYDWAFQASYTGASGSSGMDGSAGTSGSSGSTGSMDPSNPSPGGNGGNGSNGSDGGSGGDGENGPPVLVVAALRSGPQPLLQISVSAQGRSRLFLVDALAGSLTVRSDGGAGGSGGSGGRGGSGGSGGSGSPSGSSGSDGSSGMDGRSGSSGRDGLITLRFDPAVRPYLGVFHLGRGGRSTVLSEEPMARLW
jgi:hypothetical protein